MPKSSALILNWFPGTCSRVALIGLEEVGAPFEAQLIRRWDPDAMAIYKREINPKGKVPSLVADGRLITENPAIAYYLNERFGEAALLPSDPDEFLDALSMMSWFAAGVHPMITRSRMTMMVSDMKESHPSIKAMAMDALRDCFGQVEDRLSDREWLFGDWTILDGYLCWLWFRAVGSGMTAEEFPLVDAAVRRCQERPSVTRVLNREAETIAELEAEGEMPPMLPMQAGWLPAAT
jgi:glutathione S-transferase